MSQVCTGKTGHAECVQIKFDPKIISYEKLFEIFFTTHNPTTLNKQGNDIGTQYKSAIFFHNEKQKNTAFKIKSKLEKEGVFENKIVTEIIPFNKFYKAESYHQNYFENNKYAPYCSFVISPKLEKFREKYGKYLTK